MQMAQKYQITLLAGDGIGPEIMAVTVKVLEAIAPRFNLEFDFQEALLGKVRGLSSTKSDVFV